MLSLRRLTLACTAAAVILAAGLTQAVAGPITTLSAEWFTIRTGHLDTERRIDGTTLGLVESTLGPDGLPVRSAASLTFPTISSNFIRDVDSRGQIQWWTPGTRAAGTVTVDRAYSNTVTLPFNVPVNLNPGGGTTNGGSFGYLTAHLFGTFNMPTAGSLNFNLRADDDVWIFIDGKLAVDFGGVRGIATAPATSAVLTAGDHRIDLFYADRHTSQAGLVFSVDAVFPATPPTPPTPPTPSPVPEPMTLALFGAGLAGLRLVRRRH